MPKISRSGVATNAWAESGEPEAEPVAVSDSDAAVAGEAAQVEEVQPEEPEEPEEPRAPRSRRTAG